MSEVPEDGRIGPYDIVREIGRGGMVVVYLARDRRLHREVAIKCLPHELAEDPDRLGRFEREARTLASLDHPSIASVHGLEELDGRRYLVLEHIAGPTLEERLRRGPLPVEEARALALQIAEAVEAAHDKGIIHRDLKPANVKLTGRDEPPSVSRIRLSARGSRCRSPAGPSRCGAGTGRPSSSGTTAR